MTNRVESQQNAPANKFDNATQHSQHQSVATPSHLVSSSLSQSTPCESTFDSREPEVIQKAGVEVPLPATEDGLNEDEIADMAAEFEEDMENDVSSLFGDDESEEASSHTEQTSLDQEEASSLFGDELKEATEEPPLSEEENESLEREVMTRAIESELERDLEDSPEQLEDDHTDQDDEDLSDDCESVISEEE